MHQYFRPARPGRRAPTSSRRLTSTSLLSRTFQLLIFPHHCQGWPVQEQCGPPAYWRTPTGNNGYRGAGEALLSPSSPEEELQEQELRGADPNARASLNQTLRPPASDAATRVPPSWGRCTQGTRSPRLGPRRGEPHTQQDGEENPTRNPQPFGGHRKDAAEGAVGSSSVFSENGGAARSLRRGISSQIRLGMRCCRSHTERATRHFGAAGLRFC